MLRMKIKPIAAWIGKETATPKRAPFRAGYSKTKKLLETELSKIKANNDSIEVAMFVRPDMIRADGLDLKANYRPSTKHGVVLSFAIRDGDRYRTLSYPCDAFDDWQDNLRAIALSLNRLRMVSQYGVFSHADMVKRLALPSADGKLSSTDEAYSYIADNAGLTVEFLKQNRDNLKIGYRKAAATLHPDKGGDHASFSLLVDMARFLDL